MTTNRNGRSRKQIVAIYQRFYRPFDADAQRCFYCRVDYPDTIDHVPAVSRIALRGAAAYREANIPVVFVRCCAECNGLLGNRPLDTLESRAVYLYKHAQKAAKQKRFTGGWSHDEIAELGAGLRPLVAAHAKRADMLWLRLKGLSDTIVEYDEKGWPTAVSLEAGA